MRRLLGPPAILVLVAATTFGLAKWHPFTPSVPAAAAARGADVYRGETVFQQTCAGCHGADASGDVGPRLAGAGLTVGEVTAVVAAGRGVMPAGLVQGQAAVDVAAYVASLSQ
jgi:mono/diheme cytochrome c family protein